MNEYINNLTSNTDTEDLLTIGQFSEQTGLSLKALRLYHDKSMLVPVHIDQWSNYRYYAPQQVQRARCIRLLRETEMPLTMIEQFLELFEQEPVGARMVLQQYLQMYDAKVALVHQAAQRVTDLLGVDPVQLGTIQLEKQQMDTEREICLDELEPVEKHLLLAVLRKVLDATKPLLSPDDYRLVGTAASVLHGAETPARGIDILVRKRESVEDFHLAMAPFKLDLPPTYDPEERIYWASYFVDGIHVDAACNEYQWESDAVESGGAGPWTHFTSLSWQQRSVPTVNLELRLITEIVRNRPDRYEPLINHMRGKKVDKELIRRGMENRNIPDFTQKTVIERLEAS